MANVTEHSVRLKGDNKQLKQVVSETERIFKRSAASTRAYAGVLKESFKSVKDQLEGVNDILKKMAQNLTGGPGGGILKMLGGLGVAGAGIGMAVSAATAGVYARARTADEGLRLNAFGAGNRFRGNARMGYSVQETLQQRTALVQGMGGTGSGLQQIQALARVTGVDANEIIGSAGMRRSIGGGQNISAVRRTMAILSETLGDTFDKGRLGSFMGSIDQTLMSMGAGVNVDEKSFVKAFNNLLKDPTMKASPGRGTQALGAIDSAFKNASGSNFGLIMQLMSSAMPGGTPLERMFEARRGVFAEGKLGGKDRSTAIFGAMRNMFGEDNMNIGSMSEQDSILRATFLQRNMGVEGADVARSIGDAIASGDILKAADLSKDLKSPQSLQEKANDIMSSTDGEVKKVRATLDNTFDAIGDKLIPAVVGIAKRFGVSVGGGSDKENKTKKDIRESMMFLDKMDKPGFYTGSKKEFDGLYSSMDKMRPVYQKYTKRTLQNEIEEGRDLLSKTTDPVQREMITKLLDRMELFVARLETLESKNTNITVKNARGHTQDIGSKEFGK